MLGVNVDADVVQRLPWLRMRIGVLVVSNVPGALDSRQDELVPGDVVFGLNRTLVTGSTTCGRARRIETANRGPSRRAPRERMYLEFTVE